MRVHRIARHRDDTHGVSLRHPQHHRPGHQSAQPPPTAAGSPAHATPTSRSTHQTTDPPTVGTRHARPSAWPGTAMTRMACHYATRNTTAPATINPAATHRRRVTCSRNTHVEINTPNRIEVSRSADTIATGASVIAHNASPYDTSVPTPPTTPKPQLSRAYTRSCLARVHSTHTGNGNPDNRNRLTLYSVGHAQNPQAHQPNAAPGQRRQAFTQPLRPHHRHQQRSQPAHHRVGRAHIGDPIRPRHQHVVARLEHRGRRQPRPAARIDHRNERQQRGRDDGRRTGHQQGRQQGIAAALDDGIPAGMQQAGEHHDAEQEGRHCPGL